MFAAAAHALADIVDDKQEGAAVLPILAKEAHEDVEYVVCCGRSDSDDCFTIH